MKYRIFLLTFIFAPILAFCRNNPVYICTASDDLYYPCLLNLIGSIHKHNFNEICQIAVFDLGLNAEQKTSLLRIQKLKIYPIEQTHPDLLKRFNTRNWGKAVPGWYAWKAVILKQAFDLYPWNATVMWIDAGTTILKDCSLLFDYIEEHGYFFHNGSPWPMKRQTTKFAIDAFNLNTPETEWIAGDTPGMEAGFMGVTSSIYNDFIHPIYLLTFDLRFFADDGTCPNGFGECRHDQTIFSIIALKNNYRIFHHFQNPLDTFYLEIKGEKHPFHIACNPQDRIPQTYIYRARFDVKPEQMIPYIRCKD